MGDKVIDNVTLSVCQAKKIREVRHEAPGANKAGMVNYPNTEKEGVVDLGDQSVSSVGLLMRHNSIDLTVGGRGNVVRYA